MRQQLVFRKQIDFSDTRGRRPLIWIKLAMAGALSKPGWRTAHWRGRQTLCRTKYRNRNKCARNTQISPRHFLRSATSSRGSPKGGERGRSGRLSAGELLGSRHSQLEGTHAIRAARQYWPRRFPSRLRRDDLQLADNLKAADVTLTVEEIADLDAATAPAAVYPNWFIDRLTDTQLADALAGRTVKA
jgi:hypothetical protein